MEQTMYSWTICFYNSSDEKYDEIEFDAYTVNEAIRLFDDWCKDDEGQSQPYAVEEIVRNSLNDGI